MSEKRDRERVIAEITLSHLIRLGNEQGCPLTRQEALAFLKKGRAFEMSKHMMHAAEEFIAGSLFQHSFGLGEHKQFASARSLAGPSTAPRIRDRIFTPHSRARHHEGAIFELANSIIGIHSMG